MLAIAKLDRLARNARFLLSVVEGCGEAGVVFCDLPTVPAGPVGKFLVTQIGGKEIPHVQTILFCGAVTIATPDTRPLDLAAKAVAADIAPAWAGHDTTQGLARRTSTPPSLRRKHSNFSPSSSMTLGPRRS